MYWYIIKFNTIIFMTQHITKSADFVKEFMAFVKGFGVIGLALGAVIGGAVTGLVKNLTENIISPLINVILAKILNLKAGEIPNFGIDKLDIGKFVGGLIEFIVVLFIIYLAVKVLIARFLTEAEREKLGM
jgi:large conductance mechanosensitive channel